MDRFVRKINTSPKSKRKTLVQSEDNFGVPLKVLLDRDSTKPVPRIVKNICDYLLHYGLNSQGIFRINGSAKLIDGFKTTFQISAADDLYSLRNVDIYALAGVLKLFLRELPDGLVPEKLGLKCIKVAKEYSSDLNAYILKLQTALFTLPHENYELLKYLCKFLNKIAENEPVNKMSRNSLGIIFGPCVFRCSFDLQVLKNQGLTNYIMTSLIQYHDAIFVHHPKTDFLVLDHLFKLPEIVSNSALPTLEDRVQPSSEISTSSSQNNSPGIINSLQEDTFSNFVEALPLAPRNTPKPEPDNHVWMSHHCSSSEPKIPRANPCHSIPDSMCGFTVDNNLSSDSSPFHSIVSSHQYKEFLISPSTSPTPSPITFEVSSTPTFVSRSNSISYNEKENAEEVSDSGAEVPYTKTSEQLALDITNIISSMATSRSLEALSFETQLDDCFTNSTQISNCNKKPNLVEENPREKLRISGMLSRSSNKVSTGDSLFNKVIRFTHVTDDPTKIKRTFSHRKHTIKESSVHPISTWNSMPSVKNKTIKTPPKFMDSCVAVYSQDLCSQSPQHNDVISNTLKYNGYRFPNTDNTYRPINLQKDDFNAARVQDTANSTRSSTFMPVSTNHFYMEMPAANNEFANSVGSTQSSPIVENILTQVINQCSDTHIFSLSVKQELDCPSHSSSFPYSINEMDLTASAKKNPVSSFVKPISTLLYQSEIPVCVFDRSYPNHNHVDGSNSEIGNEQNKSIELATLHYDTTHQTKEYNHSTPTSPILSNHTASITLRSKSNSVGAVTVKPIHSFIHKPKDRGSCSPNLLPLSSKANNEHLNESAPNFGRLSSPERNRMITKQRIKQQCSIFDQSPMSNKNGENTRSYGAQLNKSDHFLRSAKYSSYISDSTQNFKKTLDTIGLKSLLNLSNRIYSEPDLLYFKNQLSRRTNLKYRSLQHLTTDELSSIKTPPTFKLINKENLTTIPVKISNNLLFSNKEEPNINLISPSVIRRVNSFSSNRHTSSGKCHSFLRKYSSPLLKDLRDFYENSENHNVGDKDDNAGDVSLEQSNSSLISIESFYELLCAALSKQREYCNRPERLSEMNWDQIEREKYDIQKSLLYFEGLYGRPKSPRSKRIMKPIYERYRQVKRLISSRYGVCSEFPFGMNLSRLKVLNNDSIVDVNEQSTDKQPNVTVSNNLMEFLNTPTITSPTFLQDNIHNIGYDSDSSTFGSVYMNKESSFPVKVKQRNYNLQSTKNHDLVTIENNQNSSFPFNSNHRKSLMRPDDHNIQLYRKQLCSLSPMELYNEKKNVLLKKHIVQTELVEYENSIKRVLGRKPTKTERKPMRDKYELYDLIKRQLKVVDSCLINLSSPDLINIRDDINTN
ncbi:hypothetical protein MS3_00010151 [Schistosoma haematobium]|uniref:Protein FAM13A n=1 Tax=Schistosoma haematobium TaxID=6185 RepID=A0A094ZW38_SCHHA|nr:hypothetical protein MS3_00010151 [Schistosoma haematobium]KAH9595357.1 hypothetical protein MS3_00010151 [Schistosoma haematobium]CAH8463302.1 unnamed protein product [Schistosoma haematobium]